MAQTWTTAPSLAALTEEEYALAASLRLDPTTLHILTNRGVHTQAEMQQFLHGTRADCYDPTRLHGVPEAVLLLQDAIANRQRIRIIGDYDIDGVCASYILVTVLQNLGACVDVRIPERIRDGYGLNKTLVEQAVQDGIDLLLTCDNGISAAEEIRYAKEQGLTVILTDHHEIPYQENKGEKQYLLPPADVVIDPKQPDCTYPFAEICGTVVAWKLMVALLDAFGCKEEADRFWEILALATVGDVMDLVDENRIFVKEGLAQLRQTEHPGLAALIRQNKLEASTLDAYHIGFVLGPCLNAGGRLDTAQRALDLLCAGTQEEASEKARELIALNASRKAMTETFLEEAIETVETEGMEADRVLVVYLPDCHESLAGILAGRLRERYGRPAFVLTRSEDAVKGSGRSVEAYSMFAELHAAEDLLLKYGGHPMAAGLSLAEEQVDALRERLNAACTLTPEELQPQLAVDLTLRMADMTKERIREWEQLQPFGKGNPRPVFLVEDLSLVAADVLGKNRNALKLHLRDETGQCLEAIAFGDADAMKRALAGTARLDLVGYPEIHRWNGRESLQFRMKNWRPH